MHRVIHIAGLLTSSPARATAAAHSRPLTCSRYPAPALHSMLVKQRSSLLACAAHAPQAYHARVWDPSDTLHLQNPRISAGYNRACQNQSQSAEQRVVSTCRITAVVRSRRLRRASTKVLKQLVSPATSIRAANLRNLYNLTCGISKGDTQSCVRLC